jgi:O-antigen ligase
MSAIRWSAVITVVVAAPLLVYYNYMPMASVFNDSLALVAWGLFVASVFWIFQRADEGALSLNAALFRDALRGSFSRSVLRRTFSPAGGLLLVVLCLTWWSIQVLRGDYGFLSFVAALFASVFAAWIVFVAGVSWAAASHDRKSDMGFALAFLIVGILISAVGWLQYLVPGHFEPWVNPLVNPGRIYANIRQPNHLALVLTWAVWGIVWWGSRNPKAWPLALLALLFVTPVLAFTGSRMVRVLLIVLVFLAMIAPERRRTLAISLAAVAIYAASWWGAAWWASIEGGPAFFGLERIGVSDATGGRAELWKQVIELLRQIPWHGCGPGQFNFCWTHAGLSSRVEGTLAHAHNFVLNSIVEWGWPLTLLVISWVTAGLISFLRHGLGTTAVLPAGLVLTTLCHAMLEFPLVYPYLLLPTAFALGWMWTASEIALTDSSLPVNTRMPSSGGMRWYRSGKNSWSAVGLGLGFVIILFGLAYASQYWALRSFFKPETNEAKSAENIQRVVQSTRLFSAVPSYALAMVVTDSVRPEDAEAMLPYLRLAGRGLVGPDFLARFAMVAALAKENEMAKHLAWRVVQMSPNDFQRQFEALRESKEPLFQELKDFLVKPYPVNLPREAFKNQ